MLVSIVDIFSSALNFVWWVCSLPVIDDISILDLSLSVIVIMAVIRFIITPIFSRGASSSSVDKRSGSKGDKISDSND